MTFTQQASEAIRKSGGRMTAQRRLIVDLLAQADANMDAETLYQRLQTYNADVSLATVYRTLNVLETAGLIQQRYQSPDHERRYYEPLHAEADYHFTCRRCRQMTAFKLPQMEAIKQHIAEQMGVDVMKLCMCVDGLCAACRRELGASTDKHS